LKVLFQKKMLLTTATAAFAVGLGVPESESLSESLLSLLKFEGGGGSTFSGAFALPFLSAFFDFSTGAAAASVGFTASSDFLSFLLFFSFFSFLSYKK
jgi:hypothetical protein